MGRAWWWFTGGSAAAVSAGVYWTMFSSYSQAWGAFPFRGPATTPDGAPLICLTFDDGPNEPFTGQIADRLAVDGIRATFFQVGRCVQRHPETTVRLHRDGHVIANHSWSHTMGRVLTGRHQDREIAAAQAILTRALGRRPALYRPPWLLRTPGLARVAARYGLRLVSGTFAHPLEFRQPPATRIARRALAQARPGAILIFHDGFDARGGDRSQTVLAVGLVIDELSRRGYRFVTVDELLDLPAYTPAARVPDPFDPTAR